MDNVALIVVLCAFIMTFSLTVVILLIKEKREDRQERLILTSTLLKTEYQAEFLASQIKSFYEKSELDNDPNVQKEVFEKEIIFQPKAEIKKGAELSPNRSKKETDSEFEN